MSTLRVGIATYEEMKARTMAIARGEHTPKRGEPKVWFASLQSAARVLSPGNCLLLGLIAARRPDSIAELARLSGREANNLSRTLKTMARLGLVTMVDKQGGRKAPRFAYDDIVLDIPIPVAEAAE